jgi:[ribosomal protein S18]-alanine N-acetyltransferase
LLTIYAPIAFSNTKCLVGVFRFFPGSKEETRLGFVDFLWYRPGKVRLTNKKRSLSEGSICMPSTESDQSCVHIRWMIRRDMPSVLGIEEQSFEFPWTEEEFIRCLRQRDCIGMVAERNEEVAGFMIYELHKTRIHILSFAVHPGLRRQSVGTAMVGKLVSKLAYQRRNRIVLEVRETNLAAQLFFRHLGFRATGVLKSFYEDTPEDAFLMQFRHTESTIEGDSRRIAS